MAYQLIINNDQDSVAIALLNDKILVEYHEEKSNVQHAVGDIYLGNIKKIMPGHNAAFLDVGYSKDAFLHYHDLGPQIRSLIKFTEQARLGAYPSGSLADFKPEGDTHKSGKITQVFNKGLQILVQITKEPISTKGPRLTSEITIPGVYMVLVPFSEVVSVSKRIKTVEERTRLKKLAESIRPAHCGLIIRTIAEGKSVAELHKDLLELEDKWNQIYKQLKGAQAPLKIHSDNDRAITIIRDMLKEDFNSIVVNDERMVEEIKTFLKPLGDNKEKIVRLHNGKAPIFEHFDIDKKLKSSFGRDVPMVGGGYLVIEHTEALHVIDVNSGNKSDSEINQEENALSVNIEAAKEIARQLRLRDMGGIIVVDFIDQRNPNNKRKVYETLRDEMDKDRARNTVLPMSKFGLIEITRQRVRPDVKMTVDEKCPLCEGTGEVRPSMFIIDKIEHKLKHYIEDMNQKGLSLIAHPFVAAFVTKGFLTSLQWKWFFKYKTWIKVTSDRSLHNGQYL
ncbi:MAG: Rne/Rng family ribonuclease, partial [Bacteroidetes bacterium]|nr:Rne/Rng family ribonuclease [Bacteroidota bacterium]